MQNINYNFIPFTASVIDSAVQTRSADQSLLVFPSESSKMAGLRRYQTEWNFERVRFLSMEELKNELFHSDRPILKEEKRTLAFYSCLTDKDKDFFKISNYFQSIDTALKFFSLWEELNEELTNMPQILEQLEASGLMLSEWQLQMLNKLEELLQRYQAFITLKGYSDTIFQYHPAQLDPEPIRDIRQITFVNQYYYTRLERSMIEQLLGHNYAVTLIYQLPENLLDKETLSVKPFSLRDLQGQTQTIRIYECRDAFSMFLTLVREVRQTGIRHVIDQSRLSQTFSRYCSPRHYRVGQYQSVQETPVYPFLHTLHTLLDGLMFEPQRKKILLPLQLILQALQDSAFYAYFAPPPTQQAVLEMCYEAIDKDYHYLDVDGDCLQERMFQNTDLTVLTNLFSLLKRFFSVQSIQNFIDLIDTPDGLEISRLTDNPEERELFYRTLADFASIERIKLIDDWQTLFRSTDTRLPVVPTGMLRLFLDYLAPKRVRRQMDVDSKRTDFTSLLDTRNLQYSALAVFNLVEGELPHAPSTPFLFTEQQRQIIGLKTFEDIQQREKYYFMRLVLTTPELVLLTRKDSENNIEPSSFLEQIRLYAPVTLVQAEPFRNMIPAYHALLKTDMTFAVDSDVTRMRSFFSIPHDPQQDTRTLQLSTYALIDLLDNPFTFYLKRIGRLQDRKRRVENEISHRILGNMVHNVLNRIWFSLLDRGMAGEPLTFDFSHIDTDLIRRYIKKELKDSRYYYKSPHNYTSLYLERIVSRFIENGITAFFRELDKRGFSGQPLHIYPEQDVPTVGDTQKQWIWANEHRLNFDIFINARADLRIENERTTIIDYKTGSEQNAHREQLWLYELYYLLLDYPDRAEHVQSFFYFVFKQNSKDYPGQENAARLKAELIQKLNDVYYNGYCLPEQKSKISQFEDIARKDIFGSRQFTKEQNMKEIYE
ncbi:MAG: PD-(D/E)XK nuclease family protein [candidate division KSB1 bacterium]|nr:PD-(D/E)XK nuclease family protein [candidate division KSB1 bacterium]